MNGLALRGGCLLLGTLLLLSGCRRTHYRQRADAAARYLTYEKLSPDVWPVGRTDIYVDPTSRMFDPFDLDRPPMPPDDPASHSLMRYVDGKKGYPRWNKFGFREQVEGPDWYQTLPQSENGTPKLDLEGAVRLSLLHSREYQGNLESLYLSALDVSFERFRFDTQLFAGYTALFTESGPKADFPLIDSSTKIEILTASGEGLPAWQSRRLFATGAELIVGFANSIMWEFSGADTQMATTLLDFTLLQPLLRGGGRDVVLENLTQSERTLLANIRQMARFRRSFYVQIFTGRVANLGPSRNRPVLGADLIGTTDTSGQAGGYIGLLQLMQDIRNQRTNITALQSSVSQLEAFFAAGRIDYFQVEFSRQALYNAQSRLLESERNLQTAMDNYKITLGLPPNVEFALDDSLIAPFQLVDPDIIPLQDRVTRLQQRVGDATNALVSAAVFPDALTDGGDLAIDQQLGPPVPTLLWTEEIAERVNALRQYLKDAREAIERARSRHVPAARRDNARLRGSLASRKRSAERLREQMKEQLTSYQLMNSEYRDDEKQIMAEVEALLPYEEDLLKQLPKVLDDTIADILKQLDLSERELLRLDEQLSALLQEGSQLTPAQLYQRMQENIFTKIPSELNNLSANVLSVTLVQARARTESVTLNPVDMEWEEALEIARQRRLDWMNARAALVDVWRSIQITANDLESQLDLIARGELQNVRDNPFDLRPSAGRIRLGFQFDAPLTRLEERNTFREAQIAYQQARRAYYRFEDGVMASLRDIIRRLRVNEMNFELRRAGVEVAISQVELTRLRLQEPPKPNEPSSFGATTARDLVSALNDLLNIQNDFLAVYVSQEVLRRLLDLDMGTLQLDANGMWVDPQPMKADENPPEVLPAPIEELPVPGNL